MPVFRVEMVYPVKFWRHATVEIEADDKDHAEELAHECDVEWDEGGEEHGGIEVETVTLISAPYFECCGAGVECPCLRDAAARSARP